MAQDVMTPTGVPIPVGGAGLGAWLVEEGYTTSGKAAPALSFNVAELAASVLAGAFALRLASLVVDIQKQRRIRQRCEAAREAWGVGDLDGVVDNYSEARSLSGDDPAITLALGRAYAQMERPTAESFLAFRSAALGLASEDRTLNLHGAAVSLRGIAYLLALSQATEILDQDHLRSAWRSELDLILRGAITSFEATAVAQSDRSTIRVGKREILAWRPRPLSAAMDYYLATRVALAAPFLPASTEGPRLAERASAMLERAANLYPEVSPRIGSTRARWGLELAPASLGG